MATRNRAVVREFVIAGISIVVAVAAGLDWVGKPLRLVQLVTLIGLSMTAGMAWARAVWVFRGK